MDCFFYSNLYFKLVLLLCVMFFKCCISCFGQKRLLNTLSITIKLCLISPEICFNSSYPYCDVGYSCFLFFPLLLSRWYGRTAVHDEAVSARCGWQHERNDGIQQHVNLRALNKDVEMKIKIFSFE